MRPAAVHMTSEPHALPQAVLPEIDATLGKCLSLFASQTAFTVSACRSPDMPIVYASPQFCAMTGYSPKEVLGRNCRFLQGAGTSRQAVLEIRSSIQEDRGCAVCILNYTKQNKPFWNQLCLAPISDQHGVAYYLGIQTNVTGSVLAYRTQMYSPFHITPAGPHGGVHSFEGCTEIAAQELKLAEEMSRNIRRWHSDKSLSCATAKKDFRPVSSALLPSSLLTPLYKLQHSFCLADPTLPDFPIVHASEGFLRLTGRPRDQVVGHNCRFMQGPGTDQAEVDRLRAAVAEERPISVSLINYRHDGTAFWNHLHVAPIRNADGKVVFFAGVQLNITKVPAVASPASEQTERGSATVPHVPVENHDAESLNAAADGPASTQPRQIDASQQEGHGEAQAHMTSSPENLMASLQLLSSRLEAVPEEAPLERRESIAPQEKQAQRSVVGTVRVVCRSLSAKSGLRRSLQDQHRPHADDLKVIDPADETVGPPSRLDTPTLGSSHI